MGRLCRYVDGEKVMHVYYAHKTGVYDGDAVAELNLDDVSSYGPETVTITLDTNILENGIFKYSVHNFTGRTSESTTDLSLSGAMVRVYKGNSLINTFSVPLDNEGTVWHVFDIDKEGLTVYNEFYDENGEVCIEDFYKKDNVQYHPYNDTVVEIVEWMNRLFSIKFEWGVF